ncbi:MAG: (4Fe-4S)-binding protein, partial [Planctomycetota bacterium]
IESIRDSDFVLLVTEPTPFGLNDLKLAVEMVRALKLPFGVVIIRSDVGVGETVAYCRQNHIDVSASLPDDRRVAEAYSRGEPACKAMPEYHKLYEDLLQRIARGDKQRRDGSREQSS